MIHWLRLYWDWAGSNIGAMPGCGLVALAAAWVFRKQLARVWDWLKAELHAETHTALADMRRELADLKSTAEKTRRSAAAAHQIAADTHEQMTGLRHASSPERKNVDH